MYLTCKGIRDEYFDDRYGKHAKSPCSPPVEIHDAPDGTVSFALFMEDKDAFPVCGFSWIHWTIAGLKQPYVEDGASSGPHAFVEGLHSVFGGYKSEDIKARAIGYGPMAPPDQTHTYEIYVYALDFEPDLKTGFYMNEMFRAIRGHVLAEAVIAGCYRS